jgi:opacity protein-like surface antigen
MRRILAAIPLFMFALGSFATEELPAIRESKELGFTFSLGSLQTDLAPELSGGGSGLFLGFTMDWEIRPHLMGSLDVVDTIMDYDLPIDLGYPAEDEANTNTFWIGFLLRGVVSVKRVDLYAGAGPALGFSRASVGSTSCFILCSGESLASENDWGFGLQGVAGLDVRLGERSRLGLEYRRMRLDVDFGSLSSGEINVGGDAFLLVYRKR